MSDMTILDFMKKYGILQHMDAALENVRVGQGYQVFEGLQTGKCTVDIAWNGAYIIFSHHADPEPAPIVFKKEDAPTPTEVTELQGPAQATEEIPEQPEKRKRRQYTS